MILLCKLLAIGTLAIIAFFDFKYQEFPWWTIVSLSVLFSFLGIAKVGFTVFLLQSTLNLSFLIIQLAAFTLWISIKKKQFINVINSYIGLGDILFFFCTTLLFAFENFILYHLASLLLTTIFGLFWLKVTSRRNNRIPAAGILSVILILCISGDWLCNCINFYDNSWIPYLI